MMKVCRAIAVGMVLLVPALAGRAWAQQVLVKPYVQPGPAGRVPSSDVNLLHWVTDRVPGEFEVRYGISPDCPERARPVRIPLDLTSGQRYFKYSAALTHLPLDARIHYSVALRGRIIRTNSFPTRKSGTNTIEFVVVGDIGSGRHEQKPLAYRMWREAPDFAVVVGDIVYSRGRVSEYFQRFWPVYNDVDEASPALGAPLMASTVFHAVIGNHDVGGANLAKYPDGMGAFYFFSATADSPARVRPRVPLDGSSHQLRAFRASAGMAFPGLFNYSFDNGPAHFVILDLNAHSDVNDPAFRAWLTQDLQASRAPWTFVFCHQPGFHAASTHYEEQNLRLLQPLLQSAGVDLLFAGHVHNYQRTKPLRFAPLQQTKGGHVDGVFTLDQRFNGRTVTRPEGVIHIVTGGGGASLVAKEAGVEAGSGGVENRAGYIEKFIADRHSFTRLTVSPVEVHLRQMDGLGRVIDEVRLTR